MLFQKLFYRFGAIILDVYMRWMLHRDVEQHVALPPGPKIYAINHPSTTDPFYLLAIVREQVSVLVTQIAFDVPMFGQYLHAAGHVEVALDSGRPAFEQAIKLLAEGRTVGVFPEGTLSPTSGGMNRPRTGAARLALLSGAPIIPVGIHLDRSRLRSVERTINGTTDVARWYLNGPYTVTVGEPIVLEGDIDDWDYVQDAAQDIMERIGELARESEQRQEAQRVTRWFAIRTWLPLRVLHPIVG